MLDWSIDSIQVKALRNIPDQAGSDACAIERNMLLSRFVINTIYLECYPKSAREHFDLF
jgi:hypothetical protein